MGRLWGGCGVSVGWFVWLRVGCTLVLWLCVGAGVGAHKGVGYKDNAAANAEHTTLSGAVTRDCCAAASVVF